MNLISDARWPRTLANAGRSIDALDTLLNEHPADDAFVNRIHWL